MSNRTSDLAAPGSPVLLDDKAREERARPTTQEDESRVTELERVRTAQDADSTEPGGGKEPGDEPSPEEIAGLSERVRRLERRNRWMRVGVLIAILLGGWGISDKLAGGKLIVQQKLMESKEITLLDNEGQPRMFLRVFSRVPVLQVMDGSGKPRMSLGLRFDDTPFIDLSDRTGQTRATLEMTEKDEPALRLFDESGNVKFQIN